MLPDNTLSSTVLKAYFQYPANIVRSSLLEDWELGGIALQDPSQGHRVQAWYSHVDPATGNVYVRPGVDGPDTFLFNQPNVFEYAFAFDQNMRWVASCTLADGTTQFRWYDSSIPGYTITTYTGINSVRTTLDDSRETYIQQGASDILYTYLRTSDGAVCVRNQRDRYLIEYVLNNTLANGLRITNFGMSTFERIQWRLTPRTFAERLPWLP